MKSQENTLSQANVANMPLNVIDNYYYLVCETAIAAIFCTPPPLYKTLQRLLKLSLK